MTRLPTHRSSIFRVGAAAGLGLLLLVPAGAAQAHVRVAADKTTAGAFSALTFRVPNESDTAGTVKLSVQMPQDTPFLYVSSKPVPGWKVTTTEAALPKPVESYGTTLTKAVRTVTWTADKGVQIAPGQYQEFSLQVGPLPDPGTVLLPAAQTYSDGQVVNWDQPTPAGGAEPEHPAPELDVTAADSAQSSTAAAAPVSAPPTSSTGSTGQASTASSGSDGVARALGGVGLALGVVALVVALLGRRRPRSAA